MSPRSYLHQEKEKVSRFDEGKIEWNGPNHLAPPLLLLGMVDVSLKFCWPLTLSPKVPLTLAVRMGKDRDGDGVSEDESVQSVIDHGLPHGGLPSPTAPSSWWSEMSDYRDLLSASISKYPLQTGGAAVLFLFLLTSRFFVVTVASLIAFAVGYVLGAPEGPNQRAVDIFSSKMFQSFSRRRSQTGSPEVKVSFAAVGAWSDRDAELISFGNMALALGIAG
jgi:hypothetical protein